MVYRQFILTLLLKYPAVNFMLFIFYNGYKLNFYLFTYGLYKNTLHESHFWIL